MHNRAKNIDFEDVKIGKKLHEGFHGTTFIAEWKEQKCVVKKASLEVLDDFKQEVNVLQKLSEAGSPYFAQFLGKIPKPHFCIVMEYIPGGDLHDFINDHLDIIWQPHYSIMSDVANGLTCLHDQYKILHLDVKVENILLTKDYRAKLCDFGNSINISDAKNFSGPTGTLAMIAPEMIADNNISTKCDVYSMGITFWELNAKDNAFSDLESLALNDCIKAINKRKQSGNPVSIPDKCPKNLANLIRWCWKADPDERPEARTVAEQLSKISTKLK